MPDYIIERRLWLPRPRPDVFGFFVDPRNLATLQAAALDKAKKLEVALRKKLDGGDQPLSLSGSDEVPSGFREAIAEYYRSLAKKQQ